MCMEFEVENLRQCQSLCSRHGLVVETWMIKQTIKQTYKLLTETTFCSSQSLGMTHIRQTTYIGMRYWVGMVEVAAYCPYERHGVCHPPNPPPQNCDQLREGHAVFVATSPGRADALDSGQREPYMSEASLVAVGAGCSEISGRRRA